MTSDCGPGFLLIDKPSGWTSHDVVAKVRRLTGQKKVGHAGTLDPMATGLLVLGIGRATRLLRFVQGAPKRYVATACLGVATDTLDADGAVLGREAMPVTESDVLGVLTRFMGEIHQVAPMVSARKVGGRRLYELARQGTEVEREPRAVTVYNLEVLDFAPSDYPELTFAVTCSTGTYVRTLADDIAQALGGNAHLTALRRTANGTLDVSTAYRIDTLEAMAADGRLCDALLSPAQGLGDIAILTVDDSLAAAVRNGVAFARAALEGAPESGPVGLLASDGDLIAVYRVDGGRAKADVVIA